MKTTMHVANAAGLDPAAYSTFIERLELVSVEVVKVHGERTASGTAGQTRFDLAASYMQDSSITHYRYDLSAHFTDDNGTVLGNAIASVLIAVHAGAEADGACIEQFGETSGVLIAHPYLREAIASSAQRTGFPGVLLPMIKHLPSEEVEE